MDNDDGRRARRRGLVELGLVAAAALLASPASAATYVWAGGEYTPGTHGPNPLLSPDALQITAAGILSRMLTNQSGTVDWRAGTLQVNAGGSIVNNGIFVARGNDLVTGTGSFVNSSTFRKVSGTGTTTVGVALINAGVLRADAGTLAIAGGATFNAGTRFEGAGWVDVTGGATFNGAFTSENLNLAGGTFTGNGAVLNSAAALSGGTLAGGWTVGSGSVLTLGNLGALTIQADVVNNGTLRKTGAGTAELSGRTLENNGTLDLRTGQLTLSNGARIAGSDSGMVLGDGASIRQGAGTAGAVAVSAVQKLSGAGTATIGNGFGFAVGLLDVREGTLALPDNFRNVGAMTGTGTFAVAGTLVNDGVVRPGTNGIGTLTVAGNYAQTALGNLDVQLSSTGISDLLSITGAASLAGRLNLSCVTCSWTNDSEFRVLSAGGGLSGSFAALDPRQLGLGADYALSLRYDYDGGSVFARVYRAAVAPVPEPATWAAMVFGFAAVGAGIRRRRRAEPRLA